MATPQVSTVVMEARAAVEASHQLLEEMRILRAQVRQNTTAMKESVATLAMNMNATICRTASTRVSTARLFPVALPADSPVLDSQIVSVSLEPMRDMPTPEPSAPALRLLDPQDQMALDLLTPREIEVLRLIGEGQRTKEIAFALGITFKTAVTHRSNIMEKLGIHEGPRLVRFAIRTGIAPA